MNTLAYALSGAFLLSLSLSLNIYLAVALRKSRKAPAPTADARELLNSLTRGGAVVKITVLDPEALMLRRPS